MGSRADFYIGRGEDAEWIGSIAFDGYPEGIPHKILHSITEQSFRVTVAEELQSRDDATHPDEGWPWPWEDSHTTDFAYAFDDGAVRIACFGTGWWTAEEVARVDADDRDHGERCVFPDMSDRKNVAAPGSKRSGVLVMKG